MKAGQPAPWFRARAIGGAPDYSFHTAAGRHVLMLFFGSAEGEAARAALAVVAKHRSLFDDQHACFFGVTIDPADEAEGRIAQAVPGIRFFADHERVVSVAFGAAAEVEGGILRYNPGWVLLDPMLRVVSQHPLGDGEDAIAELKRGMAQLPQVQPDWAPVLMVPNILDPGTCRHLIDLYQAQGGEESGFMREVDGKTVLMTDPQHKQRRDYTVTDEALRASLMTDIAQRLVPMLKRAFQFEATRMERYLVGCYAAGEGHFRPHRDNTTKGTAHRRFAVTINLNAGEYEGGGLRFPEFGERVYVPPTGSAVVFSCSLLHEATPVTRGTRYAFLPFLYDEAGARLRAANNPHLGPEVAPYRA